MTVTLLDMTQDILRAMGGDNVNTINDTVESTQVVGVIKDSYNYLLNKRDLRESFTLMDVTPSGDTAKPVLMIRSADIDTIEWLKYNKIALGDTEDNWEFVSFKPLVDFLQLSHSYAKQQDEDTAVLDMTLSSSTMASTKFYFYDNRAPTWFTVVDDKYLVFDSFNADVDSTLQNSKLLAFGKRRYVFTSSDTFDFTPLDPDQIDHLYNEAKTQAFLEIKQLENRMAAVRARKMEIKSQDGSGLVNEYEYGVNDGLPNYGRRK